MAVPRMLDIHELFERYAWRHFQDLEALKKIKHEFRGIDKDDVDFEINIKNLIVQHDEPEYINLHPTAAKPYSLFKAIFTNNTDREQQYSFKTERVTESVCLVAREQGFTISEEAEINLKTPGEILEFKAGFKHEMSVNKATENSIVETLMWGVDSNIVVPAHFQTSAELVVEEMRYSGSFRLNSRLSGRVTVTIVRRKDGAVIIPVTASIGEIFREIIDSGAGIKDLKSMVTIEKGVVRLVTKGQCSFQFAMKQRVVLNEEKIPEKSPQSEIESKLSE